MTELFGVLLHVFPGKRAEVHDVVEEGDKVVTRKTFHGTHEGDFPGIAPTGRSVAWDVIDIIRVRDGKVVEHGNAEDSLGLTRQLGAA